MKTMSLPRSVLSIFMLATLSLGAVACAMSPDDGSEGKNEPVSSDEAALQSTSGGTSGGTYEECMRKCLIGYNSCVLFPRNRAMRTCSEKKVDCEAACASGTGGSTGGLIMH